MKKALLASIKKFAKEIRTEEIKMLGCLGFGHAGGILSVTDLVAVLYEAVMKYDAKNPKWEGRDRLIVSKGHAGPALYSALALKGFFDREELKTLNQGGTCFPSHCDMNKTAGIDMTTGSLGQGASTAQGIAMALKDKDVYVYLILGDGECNEGQVWEMALSAPHHKLGRLIAFVDANKKQLDGTTEDILDMGNISSKFESFGWDTYDVDGTNIGEMYDAIMAAKRTNEPSMIVVHTVKGQGVSFIEEMRFNHHIAISQSDAEKALLEIESR